MKSRGPCTRWMTEPADENQLDVSWLLETSTLAVRDVLCSGQCRDRSPIECATHLHFVFPYRGAFMRHVGSRETVAELNQLIFFNESEEYQISHPVLGADACLSIALAPDLVRELAPADQLASGELTRFLRASRGIDTYAQAMVARLRHCLRRGAMDAFEAETLVLALIRRSVGDQTSNACATTYGRAKLVDRTKLILISDPLRRWTLATLGREVGVSPVYLTQVFKQVEGVPLYRYHTKLRLGRALDLLGENPDLTALALDLGYSSHSHFTSAFRQSYGCSPAEFQRSARLR